MRTIAAVLCLFSTGCIGAIVVPQIHVTPPLDVGSNEVCVFREETEWHNGWWGTLGGSAPMVSSKSIYTVQSTKGRVTAQANVGLCHFLGLSVVGHYGWREQNLILYRPGYETVVVPASPWWWPSYAIGTTVKWKDASDPEGQRNALWDLEGRIGRYGRVDVHLRDLLEREHMRLRETE